MKHFVVRNCSKYLSDTRSSDTYKHEIKCSFSHEIFRLNRFVKFRLPSSHYTGNGETQYYDTYY